MLVKQYIPVSLLLSVYYKETSSNLRECLESIETQTVAPAETVLVLDGQIGNDLSSVIDAYRDKINIRVVQLDKNYGLGYALSVGVQHCTNEIIARMDTDDIMLVDRLEKQYNFMVGDHSIDILGGYMLEFRNSITSCRLVNHYPTNHEDIIKMIGIRSPFAHMTVMFKKSSILRCGNYSSQTRFLQDYYLWLRAYLCGCKFANIPEPLVYARVKNMGNRRVGSTYIKNEIWIMRWMYKNKIINLTRFIQNVCQRTLLRLLPAGIVNIIYDKVLRSKSFS